MPVMSRVVIGDSILHHFNPIKDCDIYSFSGAKIEDISDLITKFPSLVDQSSVILLHVGTNNIHKDMVLESLLVAYHSLILKIRSFNTNAQILISSVLPRKRDFTSLGKNVILLNDLLDQYSAGWGVYFVKSYKPLLKFGLIKAGMHRDGLHLTTKGDFLVHQVFCTKLNEIGGVPLVEIKGKVLFLYRSQWQGRPNRYQSLFVPTNFI